MPTFLPYLAGQFIKTKQPVKIYNPHDNSLVGETFQCGKQVLDNAIQMAEKAKEACKKLSSGEKYTILRIISDTIHQQREELALLLAQEAAKPYKYAIAEIDRAVQTFLIAAEEAKRLPAEILSLDWTPNGSGRDGYIKYFPIGVVAGITPFNYPLNLVAHKVAPAIAAGCPIIIKPPLNTPLSSLALAKIVDQTDLPDGALSIIPTDNKVGNRLVTDERIQLLSFTGSDKVGWQMKSDAGKKKLVLELGGNAGVIIAESAKWKEHLPQLVAGAFGYAGQVCIHAQRFYVHQSHYDNICQALVKAAQKLKKGLPQENDTDISAMIEEKHAKRVDSWVQEAVDSGAKLLCGGKREGAFYTPTVLVDTKPAMKVNAEEIFGPVITVSPFNEFKDAIAEVNNCRFGLQAGIFTENIRELDTAWSQLNVGGVIWNAPPTLRFDQMPYGGIKDSGLQREGLKYAIRDMLEPRILVK